ncbi:calcium-binding protein [Paracoccus sp. (in: a-proteobacteria)]|uniref:calcium-binding protein n=1 Tax=Paracoccus sp. TaxID=267 RepID=UPI003A870E09
MAVIRTKSVFDQRDFNLADAFRSARDETLFGEAQARIYGRGYEDVYVFEWTRGKDEVRAMAVLGEGMEDNKKSGAVTGGTIQMISDFRVDDGKLQEGWMIGQLGLSVDQVTAAAKSKGRADDVQLTQQLFAGDDKFLLGAGPNFANGGQGHDLLRGGASDDTLIGGEGRDTLQGRGGDDLLRLDGGNDLIIGGDGRDMLAASGSHAVRVDLAVTGRQKTGLGNDRITGVEDLRGANGNDTLRGDDKNNMLQGQSGNDFLNGRGGNDVLVAGAGRDVLTGGAGKDQFVFNAKTLAGTSAKADVITDFRSGVDRIRIRDTDADFATGGKPGGDGPELTVQRIDKAGTDNDRTIVRLDNDGDGNVDGYLRLVGLHNLTAEDFLL